MKKLLLLIIILEGVWLNWLITDLKNDYNESMEIWKEHQNKKHTKKKIEYITENCETTIIEPVKLPEVKVLEEAQDHAKEIKEVFGKESNVALAIAIAESRLDAKRIGDTHLKKYSYGLFQINQTWHDYSEATLLNPQENIKIAKQIKDRYGWTQWTTYKTGDYKRFLTK